ncbi:MAG: DUF2480 family protein [Chitinophagaceae bacterium]
MSEVIVNRVSESGLQELNLEDYSPQGEIAEFDMKDYLFMGLILKEKDFREAMKGGDFSCYQNKLVSVICSADAIIPMWAYMLVASYLQPFAKDIVFGNKEVLHQTIFLRELGKINPEDFREKRVVVKGCGDLPVGEFAYLEITRILLPVVKSLMYGEPCSTVPIYKKAPVR